MSKKKQPRDERLTSTVFSDPVKKESPQKKHKAGKIIFICFIAAAILFIGVPMLIVMFFGNSNNDYTNQGTTKLSFNEMVERTEATEKSTELLGMKNPDLKDTATVENLIATLRLDEELGSYTVGIQNDAKPYNITLKFNYTHDLSGNTADKWNNNVIKYSIAILCLCDDVAQVNWEYPVNDGIDGAFFNRADAQKYFKLNVPPEAFAESPESIQLMLGLLGIDIY